MSETPGRIFYDEQIAYLQSKDTDALVENHYATDGEIIGFDVHVRGQQALKKHFQGYMEMLGFINVLSTDKFMETEDSIFFEATVETKLGTVQVYDAFVLRDGKIRYHFTGVK